jgi:hypothetical protein
VLETKLSKLVAELTLSRKEIVLERARKDFF